jgi:hypothetical protein
MLFLKEHSLKDFTRILRSYAIIENSSRLKSSHKGTYYMVCGSYGCPYSFFLLGQAMKRDPFTGLRTCQKSIGGLYHWFELLGHAVAFLHLPTGDLELQRLDVVRCQLVSRGLDQQSPFVGLGVIA